MSESLWGASPMASNEKETPLKKNKIGVLTLEYGANSSIKDLEGNMLFNSDEEAIDVHILHDRNKSENEGLFLPRLSSSLAEMAIYLDENRNSLFADIKMIRGVTYDSMAKIAEKLGFEAREVDEESLGSRGYKIAGEYTHTNRAKRGKKIESFYAISMPIDEFIQKWKSTGSN